MTVLWAVLAALPFGWGTGLLAARIVMRGDPAQLPAVTIPIAIFAGIVFALVPLGSARTRLGVLLGGAALGFVLDSLLPL
jgi:hypothetical protein